MRKVSLIGAALAAFSTGAAQANEPTITDAIAKGAPILEARVRYETVDQDGFANDAEALTLRTRLGWETGAWNNIKGLIEFEDVRQLGSEDYNSTINGNVGFPVIADPEVTELNRLQLSWKPTKALSFVLGRQRIALDDQRFVGAVGWRQDEQTFDALRGDVTLGKFNATYAYLNNINRVFGEDLDWDSESHLVNASYAFAPALKAQAFVYALDFDNSAANSTLTKSVRVSGQVRPAPFTLSYAATYADQEEYGPNPADFDLSFAAAEATLGYSILSLRADYEVLEGNGARGFATPLATLHAYQGWADVFLTTPATGIEDLNLGLTVKPAWEAGPFSGFEFTVKEHEFEAETTGADLGSEFDAQAGVKLGKRTALLLKYADYDGAPGFAARKKIWASLEFKL